MRRSPLPIDPLLDPIQDALGTAGCAVIVAPPGAGKTTAIPLHLLDAPWRSNDDRILLLEPRRLAARAAAARMADLLGEALGGRVGLRTRVETRISPATRIEVITEGVLTRMLVNDPALEGVGVLLFDEFHERSLQADMGLALALESQTLFRPELRIGILSATLDAGPVAALLGPTTPILESEGRSFPVETLYRDRPLPPPGQRTHGRPGWEDAVAGTIRSALQEGDGDLLVFLPGAREIRRVQERLEDLTGQSGIALHTLHGTMEPEAQQRALAPAPGGLRKIILATAVAETSLTLPGVRTVIDGGWMRVPRFHPGSGWTRLETVPVTRDAADQRRGRAGRTAPGRCYRLWTEAEDRGRPATRRPEIAEADLAPLVMDAALWGTQVEGLRWLTPPPDASLAQARDTLRTLGLLEGDGDQLTPTGRLVAQLGTHPRLGRMLIGAASLGQVELGASLAAILEDRDLLRGMDGPPDADLRLRIEALWRGGSPAAGIQVDGGAIRRARSDLETWRRRMKGVAQDVLDSSPSPSGSGRTAGDLALLGTLCALGWPDRIGRRQEGGRYQLASGRGARLSERDSLVGSPWLVALEVDDRGGDAQIVKAAPLDPAAFDGELAFLLSEEASIAWSEESGRVEATRVTRVGRIELKRGRLPNPDPEAVLRALAEGIRTMGMEALPWSAEALAVRARLAFLHHLDPDTVPSFSDEALLATLEDWLLPQTPDARSLSCLGRIDLKEALIHRAGWEVRTLLDRLAPALMEVPSGSRLPIDYSNPETPVLAVRIQEVFGLVKTPTVGGGRVPLTIHLLSPARRPVQVTRDLESFWATGYFDVRKDLRGRYPKHFWPENPLEAPATHRVRPPPPQPSKR